MVSGINYPEPKLFETEDRGYEKLIQVKIRDVMREYETELKIWNDRLAEIYTRILFTCKNPNGFYSNGGCEKESYLKDMVYIQTHWYTPPRGCTEGDYWNAGEANTICPHCGKRIRLIESHAVYKDLKKHFKEVVDEYKGTYIAR